MRAFLPCGLVLAALSALTLGACGGSDESLPQLEAATPATLTGSCESLAGRLSALANTTVTATSSVAAGALSIAGQAVPAHCLVVGHMHRRVGVIDGQTYAIGFEMRLPQAWNGRFYYQANGGLDGQVVVATGATGGGALTHALHKGFAVISSDAGHSSAQNPVFGLDPQARLDYGYQAVGKLTPMAKNVLRIAYGKGPDRSYIGGCSNGGRHVLVAAARYGDQYDGFLAGAPGFNLPKAALANIFGAQRYASVATNPADLSTGFSAAERSLVAQRVLAKCDALDGASDGLVQDVAACQAAFSLEADVPTCTGMRDGSCLTAAQKSAIGPIFSGAVTSTGDRVYASFPYDAGLGSPGVAFWEFTASVVLDPGAVGFVFQVPPVDPAGFNPPQFSLSANIDALKQAIETSNSTYTESAMSFMTPPNPSVLGTLEGRGAKLMVYHGVSDPIFSVNDTETWYRGLRATKAGSAADFARFYRVPGMGHCSGGPATDQFDMLASLVDWVEHGRAPDQVVASARGVGNAGGVNADVPVDWAPDRTRPLCPFPQVARYKGTGSLESAANFECR